jgi:hypothetical protein
MTVLATLGVSLVPFAIEIGSLCRCRPQHVITKPEIREIGSNK